jgi:PX domain
MAGAGGGFGDTNGSGEGDGSDGGGLFDDVDQEEEEMKRAEEARVKAEEMARQQKKQEEAEAARKQQEQAMMLQQQQQQQQQQMNQQQQMQQQQTFNGQAQPQAMGGSYMQQPQLNTSVSMPFTPQQQQQLNSQMQNMTLNHGGGLGGGAGFYREHEQNAPPQQNQVPGMVAYSTGGGMPHSQNNYYYGTQQQHQGQPMPGSMRQPGFTQPSTTAGMHNAAPNMNLGRVRNITLVKPEDVAPLYSDIKVSEPMLIQNQSFLISSPPYWSYQITSVLAGNQGTWLVRRRFRHVVALEDRLRQFCPGSILPPRPEKHATRAIEEASTHQSAEFAMQRAKELERYLNNVAKHPVAGQSQVLRLFLGLQDDIGTAWPECSTNALTRLGAVGAGVSMKVAETTNLTAASSPAHEWEEDAELLSLTNSENLRLGAVSQAVPKLEGLVMILREQGDAAGALGMELSKASRTLDADFKIFEILSNGLLRQGRRTKRLSLEMSAAAESFLQQYKLVRYEKMAMNDRRHAIQRKAKERGRADARAYHLSMQQRQLQYNGQMNHLTHLEQSAINMDGHALDAVTEADEIGARLKSEIHRVAITRRTEWNSSMKTIASSMKEACAERAAIWASTLDAFENLMKAGGPGPVPPANPPPLG